MIAVRETRVRRHNVEDIGLPRVLKRPKCRFWTYSTRLPDVGSEPLRRAKARNEANDRHKTVAKPCAEKKTWEAKKENYLSILQNFPRNPPPQETAEAWSACGRVGLLPWDKITFPTHSRLKCRLLPPFLDRFLFLDEFLDSPSPCFVFAYGRSVGVRRQCVGCSGRCFRFGAAPRVGMSFGIPTHPLILVGGDSVDRMSPMFMRPGSRLFRMVRNCVADRGLMG